MSLELPEIPYDFADLEPVMSRDTLLFHFAQHHRGSFDRTVALVRGTELEHLALEDVVRVSAGEPDFRAAYRQAAEAWNHNFFWKSMRPGGGGSADGLISDAIRTKFGGFETFVAEFKDAAAAVFGSGWLWVTWKADAIQIVATTNADTPIVHGHTALLGLDLWEHAYYLDHQNRRSAYVVAFLEELVDWDFANRNLQERIGTSDVRTRGLHSGAGAESAVHASTRYSSRASAAEPARGDCLLPVAAETRSCG